MFIRSNGTGSEFHFATDLTGNTTGRRLLIATAAFAAQPGAVTPDYLMPDGFLRLTSDTLALWNEQLGAGGPYPPLPSTQWDTLTYGSGRLPTDGTNSLHRDHAPISIAVNSPTNYAGQSGSITPIPEPAAALLVGAGLAALAAARRERPRRAQ
jgi:hypothetical protein